MTYRWILDLRRRGSNCASFAGGFEHRALFDSEILRKWTFMVGTSPPKCGP